MAVDAAATATADAREPDIGRSQLPKSAASATSREPRRW